MLHPDQQQENRWCWWKQLTAWREKHQYRHRLTLREILSSCPWKISMDSPKQGFHVPHSCMLDLSARVSVTGGSTSGGPWHHLTTGFFFPTANKRPRQIYWCEHSSWKGRKQKQKTKTSEGSGSKTWIFTNEITFLKILLLLFLRKHSTSLPQGYGQPLRDCSCSGRCHHLLCYNQKRNAPNCPTYYSFIYTRSTIRIIWNDTSLWCFL